MSDRRLHPAIAAGCPVCKETGYRILRRGEWAVAERCTCVGRCPECRDTTWVARGEGPLAGRSRCRCVRLNTRIARWNQAAIPGRHAGSTRATFRPLTKDLAQSLRKVSSWLRAYKPGEDNRGLVLYGDVGRGKTHLLVAMLHDLVFEHGATVRFIEFSHLLADIKSGFDRGEGSGSMIEELVAVDVLAIDELGKGRNTEFEGTVLDELVSRRYNAARTILATTNFLPGAATGRAVGDLASGELPALIDRVGPRVFSRLREICDFQTVVGEDFRVRLAAGAAD